MITIGIITPLRQYFKVWLDENKEKYKDAEIIHIARMKDVDGKRFNKIIRGYRYYEVPEDIEIIAKLNLKQ